MRIQLPSFHASNKNPQAHCRKLLVHQEAVAGGLQQTNGMFQWRHLEFETSIS